MEFVVKEATGFAKIVTVFCAVSLHPKAFAANKVTVCVIVLPLELVNERVGLNAFELVAGIVPKFQVQVVAPEVPLENEHVKVGQPLKGVTVNAAVGFGVTRTFVFIESLQKAVFITKVTE